MQGLRATIGVGVLVGAVLLPLGAPAGAGKRCETVVRKYAVAYEGSWHSEGYSPAAGGGVASYTDDAMWDLESEKNPVKMTTSDCRGGGVAGGVRAAEMKGSAVRTTTTTTAPGTNREEGPGVLDAMLDSDEGTNKQHQLGASGADYGRYGNEYIDIYPMSIDARRPRKRYELNISGEQQTTGATEGQSSSISATWTLELVKKKRRR